MPCFAFTGRTGQGKGLCAAAFCAEYIGRGKVVATNMDIFPEHFRDKYNRNVRIIRLPDCPTIADFIALGLGNDNPKDEDENGLIMLDEAGTFFNSRKWNEKGRDEVVSWIRHRRKYGWDLGFQIQGLGSLDTQIREDIIDYEVRCFNIATLHIPIVSSIIKMFTGKAYIKFPKWMRWHTAKFKNLETGMIDSVHRYTGRDVYNLYDTEQVIDRDYPHAIYSYLTPWHLVGRYQTKVKVLPLIPKLLSFGLLYIASKIDGHSREYLSSKFKDISYVL